MERDKDRVRGILTETRADIVSRLGPSLNALTVERVVIGLFFTGVKLSNGQGGVCYTPIKTIPEAVCCPSSARAMPSSGELRGRPAADLLDEMWGGSAVRKAVGIATLNALSATCWEQCSPTQYAIERGVDALDTLSLNDEQLVVVVGALAPFLKILKRRGKPFRVLELDPTTLKPDELPFYAPADQAGRVVPQADVLVVTGTSLINDTLEDLLALARPEALAVVVGPTASMLPDAFFRRGVDVVGGVLVTAPDALLDVLSEAGSGFHFFGRSAERVVVRRPALRS
ncbi:MAG: DUF364 domain-containing protein [Thermoleophilia bacterium]|nr:DUF364 domain-containing protein [Thermoleophilia bacterium]